MIGPSEIGHINTLLVGIPGVSWYAGGAIEVVTILRTGRTVQCFKLNVLGIFFR